MTETEKKVTKRWPKTIVSGLPPFAYPLLRHVECACGPFENEILRGGRTMTMSKISSRKTCHTCGHGHLKLPSPKKNHTPKSVLELFERYFRGTINSLGMIESCNCKNP